MNHPKTTYYLIRDRIVGKTSQDRCYIFANGAWTPDTDRLIMDHLAGFDPFEPEDSPYRYGSASVLFEIEEITAKRAAALTGGRS